jgi:hypothetical protein
MKIELGATMTGETKIQLQESASAQQSSEMERMMAVDLEKATLMLAERLDFLDVQIMRKFYSTGKAFPFDTQPFCFPILYKEMKEAHRLKICQEALRKRLDNLTKSGFLIKIRGSNPVNYEPVRGKENVVRAVITKFFLIHGLTKFL